jgi:general secretion pathway protein F
MPVFEYTAINPTGKDVKGLIDAENVRVARQRLRGQGIFPTDIKESNEAATTSRTKDVKRIFKANRVSTKELAVATRQLATLVGAGLPLVSALAALSDQTDAPVLKRIVIDVREKVEEGESLAKALGNFPKSFPSLYINMVSSGEASGTLDAVLLNLADYLEAQLELQRKISSALMYPIIMLIICSLVIVGLLVFLVPRIVEMFKKQGATLPFLTRITIGVSDFIVHYWYLIILLIVGVAWYLRWFYKQPHGRDQIDRLLLRVPLYGSIYRKISTGRITRTLGTLLSSGVGLLAALDITRNIVQNVHFAKALEDAKEGVREGRSLAKELGKSGLFPSMVGHMIAIGEKSGELESMLVKTGRAYETEVNATISGLTSLIEPLMLIVVGCIVFIIVISVLLPMVDLISVVQQ